MDPIKARAHKTPAVGITKSHISLIRPEMEWRQLKKTMEYVLENDRKWNGQLPSPRTIPDSVKPAGGLTLIIWADFTELASLQGREDKSSEKPFPLIFVGLENDPTMRFVHSDSDESTRTWTTHFKHSRMYYATTIFVII